ncbi:MAG: glycerol-3-phosphate responsive antiterminator [Clostridia bacterium]|nr:glycerol-3-phosphate responsive antiterminator [Clostridia bacterium]
MRSAELLECLGETPIIAAVKSMEGLHKCLSCDCKVVFVLFGDILNIGDIVEEIKNAGKSVFVHIDLIDGLASREIAVDFLIKYSRADGIISTKQALVRYAKSKGLLTVQRFFLLDSLALENVQKHIDSDCSDLVEILPGAMPKIITKLASTSSIPIIAGGLISDKEDIIAALAAGALAISSTDSSIWFM